MRFCLQKKNINIFEMFEMSHCQCYALLSDVLPEVSNFHKEKKIL